MLSEEDRPLHRSDGGRDIERKSIEAFLAFVPVSVRNRFDKSMGRSSLRSNALLNYIVEKLVSSPVPFPLLLALAKRSGFEGLPLILKASDAATGPSLFSKNKNNIPGNIEDFQEEGSFATGLDEQNRYAEELRRFHIDSSPSAVNSGSDALLEMNLDEIFEIIFKEYGEKRTGQLKMAKAVLGSMEGGKILIVEAGTGTGKSLAYLVPAIIYALRTGKRVAISTYTRNLQNQLYLNEVPRVKRLFGVDFDVVRLMGRDNYICPRRVMRIINRFSEDDEPVKALNVALAAILSDEGLIYSVSNIDSKVQPSSLAPPKRCLMANCAFADSCPFLLARKRCLATSIALINHSLVFNDYTSDRAIVGEYDTVIFDEAHNLEKAAINSLSISVGRSSLGDAEETIGHILKGDELWKLIYPDLAKERNDIDWKKRRKEITETVGIIGNLHKEIFGWVVEKFNGDGVIKNVRTRYKDGAVTFSDVREKIIDILLDYNGLQHLLKPIVEAEISTSSRQFQKEIEFALDVIDTIKNSLDFLTTADEDDYVFWFEWDERGMLRVIASSPIFVDRRFADFLEDICKSAVFTSATLYEQESFEFFKKRLGLGKVHREKIELSIPSPFPFDKNCLALVASDSGDPAGEDYAGVVAQLVFELAHTVRRRMIVLFTSYRLLFETKKELEGSNIEPRLMIQGGGESRETLADRLRSSQSGILFGVASFWEGVDFPGEELEVLVITKTPFPVPVEPIIDARAGMCRRMGEDPFEKLLLPEAILRMKQGIGRLIRRNDDRGVVIMLDSRLVHKKYGKTILNEMPTSNVKVIPLHGIVSAVKDWFENK